MRDSQSQTGGGKLTAAEKRANNNPLFKHVVSKLGISAVGNAPRHDSDATTSIVEPPTNRLKRSLRISSAVNYDEETRMSTESEVDFPNTSLEFSTQGSSQSGFHRSIDQPSTSTATASSSSRRRPRQDSEASVAAPAKRQRKNNHFSDMQDVLKQQIENNELQTKYLELSIERAEIAKNRENILLRRAEIELKQAEECMRIEIEKKQKLADMEIEARRRELDL